MPSVDLFLNVFILLSFLRYIYSWYRILEWQLFFLQNLRGVVPLSSDLCFFLMRLLAIICNTVPYIYIYKILSLVASKLFLFSLWFMALDCRSMFDSSVHLLCLLLNEFLKSTKFFTTFEKFFAYYFLNIFLLNSLSPLPLGHILCI